MPDHANARLALRRLVAGLIIGRDNLHGLTSGGEEPLSASLTTDEILARLDTNEAADLEQVMATLTDSEADRPRFVHVPKDIDYKTGAARGYAVVDLAGVDDHQHGGDLFASCPCPTEVLARTLTANLNANPPEAGGIVGYDEEPF